MGVMLSGPRPYDLEVEILKRITQANTGVFLVVAGGEKQDGYASKGSMEFMLQLPKALRDIANEIEKDIKNRIS